MLLCSKTTMRPEMLETSLRNANRLTAQLMADVIRLCTRLPALRHTQEHARLNHLIEREAWTDAVLTLIKLEIPQWKLRRLVFEDGGWLCSLSKQPMLPIEIDDTVDTTHDSLEIALLCAFMKARQSIATAPESNARPLPNAVQSPLVYVICTENFA
jgi:hypothetical protein